jgi:hypothetical protein
MDDNLITNVHEDGLLIPKAWLIGVDKVEIFKKNDVITIRPFEQDGSIVKFGKNPVSWDGDSATDLVGICDSDVGDGFYMNLKAKLVELSRISQNRSDDLERNKKIWIQEVNKLYKVIINDWFREYIEDGYMSYEHHPLDDAECVEFFENTQILELKLGGEYGDSVILEPAGINVAGALGKIDLYFQGHRNDGVFLLLIEEDDGQFDWEIWKSGRQKEAPERFNRESFEKLIGGWLEKWADV